MEKEFNIGNLRIVASPHKVILYSKWDSFKINDELYKALDDAGKIAWKCLNYQEISGFGNDYWEYYDREFDNNGYAGFHGKYLVEFDRPSEDNEKLHQFNKAKFQTFMYDLNQKLSSDK